jgi:hypothetical protein
MLYLTSEPVIKKPFFATKKAAADIKEIVNPSTKTVINAKPF